MSIEIKVGFGTTDFKTGWRTIAEASDPFKIKKVVAGVTAFHEAGHIVPHLKRGKWVRRATIEPGPGYLGKTEVDEYDPVSFMGPRWLGCDGRGHDEAVVIAMGDDPGSSADAAGSYLRNAQEDLRDVAALLQKNKTITGSQAKEVMDRNANPEVNLYVIDPSGNVRHFVEKIKKGQNEIPLSKDKFNPFGSDRTDHPLLEKISRT